MRPSNEYSTTKRTYLRLLGGAIGGTSLLTGVGTVGATGSPGTVVDLGAEGLQPGDDLTPLLEAYWQPGYEVHVPGGEYVLSDPTALSIDADEHAWLVGDGNVVADHGDQHVEFNVETRGETHVRLQNITLRGVDQGAPDSKIRARAWDETGLIEFINFDRPDGTAQGWEGTGFYVPSAHAGTARFINCHIENFTDNGLYSDNAASTGGANGPVEVYGGLYKNNHISGIRLSSDDSLVQSVAIVNDATARTFGDDEPLQRGIRIRHAGENIRVDDCDIYHPDVEGVRGPFEVEDGHDNFGPGGSTTVTNTRIRNDTDIRAINTETDAYDIGGDTIDLTGTGNLELDGDFTNVVRGPAATSPTTEERFYDWQGGSDAVVVSTSGASDITETSAVLEGSLDDLGGAASAEVYFQYRVAGASTWTTSGKQTLSSAGPYSQPVSGLGSATDYEFRAAAAASDGDTATGSTLSFTTSGGDGGTAPVIDTFAVTEAGSPNPHANITAEWTVSDADGDLESVRIEVVDAAGTVRDSSTTTVSGETASGVQEFLIKQVDGQTLDVTLFVTDTAGNETSTTRQVTATSSNPGRGN